MFEIDEVTRSGKLSDPPQHDEVSNHCPYYIACLREAMRLNPAAPTMLPRLAPKGGLEIHGRFVPEGTELTCNPWIIHRDPGLYGEDADAYRPERWLAGDDKVKEYHKYNVAFGYGGRLCLGKDLAMMELFKGPLCLLRSFKLTLRNEQQPARYSVKGGVSYFEDMWVKIEKRAQVV